MPAGPQESRVASCISRTVTGTVQNAYIEAQAESDGAKTLRQIAHLRCLKNLALLPRLRRQNLLRPFASH